MVTEFFATGKKRIGTSKQKDFYHYAGLLIGYMPVLRVMILGRGRRRERG